MSGDRIDELEERLRTVEMCLVELSTMAKYFRYLVAFVGISLGVDVSGLV